MSPESSNFVVDSHHQNTPAQTESLLHSLGQAVGGIRLPVKANRTRKNHLNCK